MAYKFQLGSARLSGSTLFEEDLQTEGAFQGNSLVSQTTVSGSGQISGRGLVLDTNGIIATAGDADLLTLKNSELVVAGGVSATSNVSSSADGQFLALDINGTERISAAGAGTFVGVAAGGAITGATTIAGSGLASVGSLAVDDSSTIGCDSDTDLLTLANQSVVVAANAALTYKGTAIDSTGAELNLLDGSGAGTIVNSKAVIYSAAGKVSASALVVGTADMDETDLEKLDGITNGQAAASKALVLDSSKVIVGIATLGATQLSASSNIKIGNADMDETDLEKLDGITNGTVAANKAVVVDTNKDADGFRNIDGSGDLTMGTITMTGFAVDADGDTALKSLAVDDSSTIGCDSDADILTFANQSVVVAADAALTYKGTAITSTGAELNLLDGSSAGSVVVSKAAIYGGQGQLSASSLVVGTADMSEEDLEKLDGITNGAAAASKALVLDSSKDISGINALSAATVSGSGQLSGLKLVLDTNGVIGTAGDADLLTLKNNELSVAGAVKGTSLSSSAALQVGGAVQLDGVGEAAGGAQLSADGFYVRDDSASGALKFLSMTSYASSIAGAGLSASAGQLVVEGGQVGAVTSGSTLSEGYNYFASDLAAKAGLSLPSDPSIGDVVTVKAKGGVSQTNFVEVKAQGSHTIDGEDSVRIESPFGAITCVYVVADDWRIV